MRDSTVMPGKDDERYCGAGKSRTSSIPDIPSFYFRKEKRTQEKEGSFFG